MRSRPGTAPTSSTNGRAFAGAAYGSPTPGTPVAGRSAALSRTEIDTTCSAMTPAGDSPSFGPMGFRPRVGFSPKIPQAAAGIRIEPPASLACATGTNRAATAAAAPPLEPPVECARFQGFLQGPQRSGSVVGGMP